MAGMLVPSARSSSTTSFRNVPLALDIRASIRLTSCSEPGGSSFPRMSRQLAPLARCRRRSWTLPASWRCSLAISSNASASASRASRVRSPDRADTRDTAVTAGASAAPLLVVLVLVFTSPRPNRSTSTMSTHHPSVAVTRPRPGPILITSHLRATVSRAHASALLHHYPTGRIRNRRTSRLANGGRPTRSVTPSGRPAAVSG